MRETVPREMTYMEKPSSGKPLLDDTVPLTAVIEASQNVQSHTVSLLGQELSGARLHLRLLGRSGHNNTTNFLTEIFLM